jgi:hypothetical protein
MKMIMKEQTNKANNLRLGAIYVNNNTGQPARLVNIVSCQGVWLESYDGQGYGDLVQFNDCHYADTDEVQDFLQDLEAYTNSTSAKDVDVELGKCLGVNGQGRSLPPLAKGIATSFDRKIANVQNYDQLWGMQGYYNDNDGNDIRCRD